MARCVRCVVVLCLIGTFALFMYGALVNFSLLMLLVGIVKLPILFVLVVMLMATYIRRN